MARFGWCVGNLPDGQHERCWVENNGLRCSCECHEKKGGGQR